MTTLSQHNSVPDPERLAALPRLPRDEGGPVFREPWEAQAFALAVKLSEQGHFTWKEWAAALAAELKAAADRGEPDDGSHYYEHWLATLERLVTAKGLSDPAALAARKEAWADAYRHTPHGKPVELAAGAAAKSSTDFSLWGFNRTWLACEVWAHWRKSDRLKPVLLKSPYFGSPARMAGEQSVDETGLVAKK